MLLIEKNKRFADAMDEFFEGNRSQERVHYPAAEIRNTEDGAVVSLDLPGVEREGIEISLEKGKYLVCQGERKQSELQEGEKQVLQEAVYGKMKRVFELPFRIDDSKTQASYKNGVLRIRVYKSEEEKPRRIEVTGE